ncbi:MAG: hypothetical protein D6679_14065 [Candidatus Hydrogenedentota bacterium]|nr:MAG: hypothetical protein D6679_14065 [Candidatus Hydrogenedentota bacterium]
MPSFSSVSIFRVTVTTFGAFVPRNFRLVQGFSHRRRSAPVSCQRRHTRYRDRGVTLLAE